MKKKLIAIIVLAFVISGCGHKTISNNNNNNAKDKTTVISGNTTNDNDAKGNNEGQQTVEQGKAVYTGEEISSENSDNPPFLAVIENIKAARPQSGLSRADIVFETLAEGGIPRCMALFQSHVVDSIGPIRSDRVYFNEIANSMNLPFAHCGGSQTAIDEIDSKHLMSLNEMRNGKYYHRSKLRKMPHNLYTSSDLIGKLISKKGYSIKPNFNMEFDKNYWTGVIDRAEKVKIKMSGYYTTSYVFQNDKYTKLMNNTSVVDKNNGEVLTAKNIVVQITKISQIAGDKKLRVEVGLTGSGKGYVISNGSYKRILWSKASGASQIKLTDENGNNIKLSPGNTWWEIVDGGAKISFNDENNTTRSSTSLRKKSRRN